MTEFFFLLDRIYTVFWKAQSKKIFSIAIFLPRVLTCQKREISLPVSYKTALAKTEDWEWLWRHFRTFYFAAGKLHGHFLICVAVFGECFLSFPDLFWSETAEINKKSLKLEFNGLWKRIMSFESDTEQSDVESRGVASHTKPHTKHFDLIFCRLLSSFLTLLYDYMTALFPYWYILTKYNLHGVVGGTLTMIMAVF